MKSVYENYMNFKGITKDLSNNFENFLQSDTRFMNGYAKHHDKQIKMFWNISCIKLEI